MKMISLYNLQNELDTCIRKTKGITKEENELLGDTCLAVVVETGEFIAETEKEKALGEYVDILHFLLRINNILELDYMATFEFEDMYQSSRFELKTTREKETLDFIEDFTKFVNGTRCFKYWSNKGPEDKLKLTDKFAMAMFKFLSLGNFMNFTAIEVINAYLDKREENFNRQRTGY